MSSAKSHLHLHKCLKLYLFHHFLSEAAVTLHSIGRIVGTFQFFVIFTLTCNSHHTNLYESENFVCMAHLFMHSFTYVIDSWPVCSSCKYKCTPIQWSSLLVASQRKPTELQGLLLVHYSPLIGLTFDLIG